MKKSLILLLAVTFLLGGTVPTVTAQTTPTVQELLDQVQNLLQQIQDLQAQINTFQAQQAGLRQELRGVLRLARSLEEGMTSEEVRLLQEILATDPSIYPEKLVTGFFGPLTKRAVQKFQARERIVSSGDPATTGFGRVGPRTLARINQILTEGNASGKVPPGLLIAPGIAKKLGFTLQPLPGQILPPGIAKKLGATTTPGGDDDTGTTTPDTTAPVISDITATSTASTSATISWQTDESADSTAWYSTTTPLTIASTTPRTSESSFVTNHVLTLSNLIASTMYYYKVVSSDQAGNTATSSEESFATLGE